MIAPTASMNPTVVTTGPELGLDLGRSISAVGEHIIAGVARVQQPIQLLAVVHGRIGHGIMPDQLVLGVRVHMVLVAEEAAAMLLGPARIAVLLPHFGGLLLPPRWCAPSIKPRQKHVAKRMNDSQDIAGPEWRDAHTSRSSIPSGWWRRA